MTKRRTCKQTNKKERKKEQGLYYNTNEEKRTNSRRDFERNDFVKKTHRKRRDHASQIQKENGKLEEKTKKMCMCSIERVLTSNLIVVDFDILKSNSLKNTLVKDRKDGIYFTGK